MSAINTQLAMWQALQNVWYGLSLGSVLLLAAIGLAITFGVMGIINMAHGEMVMIGAYTTYVVQEIIRTSRPACSTLSLFIAVPLAFLVSGAVGIAIERLVIRHLYGRPARDAARHLGHLAHPAAGGAHHLRAEQQGGRRAELHGGLVPPRRARDHLRPHVDHRLHDRGVLRPAARAAGDALRPADAGRDAEPPHGLRHGHLDRPHRCAGLRARLGHRRHRRGGAERRSTTSRPTSARATSSTASWWWCSAASAICGARWWPP